PQPGRRGGPGPRRDPHGARLRTLREARGGAGAGGEPDVHGLRVVQSGRHARDRRAADRVDRRRGTVRRQGPRRVRRDSRRRGRAQRDQGRHRRTLPRAAAHARAGARRAGSRVSAGVERFTVSERALHWALALGYLLLLASGLPLMMPALQGGIRGYSLLIGERLHIACAIFWVLTMIATLALGDRRRVKRTLEELARLEPSDRRWLRSLDRKSTRLNSSHDQISYAVFCLKKKKRTSL